MIRLWQLARRLWFRASAALRPLFGKRGQAPVLLQPGSPCVFPDPRLVGPDGLIAVGGDLSIERLLAAYRLGIFPWYDETTPILWWSPDPRGILEFDDFHISRSLARTLRSGKFRLSTDEDFASVVAGCATRVEGTWITGEMKKAYLDLHHAGHAHSVEVWQEEILVGGIYGVSLGGVFAGESMFSRVRDASKVALAHLVSRLRSQGYFLFDIQQVTTHTLSLGAREIPRAEYLARLAHGITLPISWEKGVAT